MSDLYSIISEIEPTGQDILEAELFAKQILEAKYPDLDLREGTAIRDLNLRPAAFILALCSVGLKAYFSQNTISAQTDESPEDLVDNLMGNLFLTRNSGTYSVINVRLYFGRQKAVSLATSTSFSTDGQLLFFPPTSINFPLDALTFDSYLNKWYVDVDLVAGSKGSQYNLDSGSLLYFSNFDPFFLNGEINYLSQVSSDSETNLQFIERARSAISTRNLINIPSIDSNLRSQFNFLNRVYPVTAGDPELYRDQVEIAGQSLPETRSQSTALSDSNSKILIELPGHGFLVGQLLDIREPGTNTIVMKSTRVTDVVDGNFFKVLLSSPFSTARSISRVYVAKVWEPMYIHAGGVADIYCGEEVTELFTQYTTNSSGSFTVTGALVNIFRSSLSAGTDPDTIPLNTAFSISNPNLTSRSDVTITQDGALNVKLTMPGHPLTVGRAVALNGWPSTTTTTILQVRQVQDENVCILGDKTVDYDIQSGLSTIVSYVEPRLDYGFSQNQSITVSFGSSWASKKVSMGSLFFNNIPSIQAYLDSSDNHVVCADFLARGYDLYRITIDITVYNTPTVTGTLIQTILNTYLASLPPGSDLVVSELVSELGKNGVPSIKSPMTITAALSTKDLLPPISIPVVDTITPYHGACIYNVIAVNVTHTSLA